MISKDEIKLVIDTYIHQKDVFNHNYYLLDIYEGNLKPYIDYDLQKNLSSQSYDNLVDRITPINVLTKIVDKLSCIYTTPPTRKVEGSDLESDTELLSWYEQSMNVNCYMQDGTELYNLSKSHLIQPYVHNNMPRLRVIPNDRFFVLSTDPVDPMTPTHVVYFNCLSPTKTIFYIYTATHFLIVDQDGVVQSSMMVALNNPEGLNPYGAIPFIYANASRFRLFPTPNTDVFTMTKLIPILMTDLNYAVKFQAFSIMYGINVNDENLKMSPNAFWRFKSDNTTDQKPEIGMIKPQVDIDQTLGLIQSQLSLWLNSKGIRPGAVGSLNKDNFANGISKIIDEMDTMEYRQKLIDYYKKIEDSMWNLILNYMHPVWSETGQIENKAVWSEDASVNTIFSLQLPANSRADMVKDLKLEMETGFISRREAIKKLNPELSDEEIEKKIKEIDEETKDEIKMQQQQPQGGFG